MSCDGVLVVDKAPGATSADVVRVAKRLLGCKTGHLGTLDPFATGVLPLCLGEGTKLAPFLNEQDKDYEGLIRLGRSTSTGDPTGTMVHEAAVPSLNQEDLAVAAARHRGDSLQTPPMYSAIKRQGVPLYKLARQGVEVDRQPRAIHIAALDLESEGPELLRFRVSCSKGTYIRVLAEQIALTLGTVGHLESLRRTRFGCFTIGQSTPVERINPNHPPIIGMREALRGMNEVALDRTAAERARGGYEPLLRGLPEAAVGEHAKLIGPSGDLVAVIAADDKRRWRFLRVFAAPGKTAYPDGLRMDN